MRPAALRRFMCLIGLLPMLTVRAQPPRARPDAASDSTPAREAWWTGCWNLSEPIFRGLPLDSTFRDPPWSLFELTYAKADGYSPIRVLGAPDRPMVTNRENFQVLGWLTLPPDSVLLIWRATPNAMEVRLAARGDSAVGEFFYHGDILLPGDNGSFRRPPVPISAKRTTCPRRLPRLRL